jgi:hypothetical protein
MIYQREVELKVREAVKYFWATRDRQAKAQGSGSGKKDSGARAAVTGGAQMDGFVRLIRERLYDGACLILSDSTTGLQGIYREPSIELCFNNFATALTARAIAGKAGANSDSSSG